ncbi:MAG: hypothetical protein IKO10_15155 [Lachnospiraceae bacterium]|nr:hypothetical protein [Lachnospiraceae bacterium]
MTQEEKTTKVARAELKLRQAQAEYKKVLREEKERERKEQDRHKYMMGGCVVKYFPEAYDFNELEMNRIIACAFSLKDVQNMIRTVVKEKTDPDTENDGEEEYDGETEESDYDAEEESSAGDDN